MKDAHLVEEFQAISNGKILIVLCKSKWEKVTINHLSMPEIYLLKGIAFISFGYLLFLDCYLLLFPYIGYVWSSNRCNMYAGVFKYLLSLLFLPKTTNIEDLEFGYDRGTWSSMRNFIQYNTNVFIPISFIWSGHIVLKLS